MPEQQNPSPLRERLVDVGVELVLAEGAGAVGLREIARRAGVSHGAPRRHFPTHQDLLSAIARRGFADLGARFAAATEGVDSPDGRLRALCRTYVGYALERRGMFELMFRHELLDSERRPAGPDPAGPDSAPAPRPLLRDATLPLFRTIVGLLTEAGHRRPETVAAALWANLHGLAQLWAWGSLQLALGPDSPDDVSPLVTSILDTHLGAEADPA